MAKDMQARLVNTEEDVVRAATILLQLRPQYDLESIVAQIKIQQAGGFMLAIVENNNQVIAVAGFVITEKLAWGKSLYVDDLVTDEKSRSLGAGNAMITWLKQYAREQGCRELHLDSGVQRKDAHRFYDREGFERASIHFSITDLNN